MRVAPMDLNLSNQLLLRVKSSGNSKADVLGNDRTCVIMCHDMLRTNHNIVSSFDDLAPRKTDGVFLDDLFDDRLWNDGFVGGDGGEEPLGSTAGTLAGP